MKIFGDPADADQRSFSKRKGLAGTLA